MAFNGKGEDKRVKHDQEKKVKDGKASVAPHRRAQKAEHRRFTYAVSAEAELLQTYTNLPSREKARFRELWKDDPGFSYVEQFKSRTMSKVKADEDTEAII